MGLDLNRLYQILSKTTVQLRKGEEVVENKSGAIKVTEVFAMPHEKDAQDGIVKVDVEFMVIGVDRVMAMLHRGELAVLIPALLPIERIREGPSYIEVGAQIGDQGAALQLFALGQVLGFWKIITPAFLGLSGAEAHQFAGIGAL